MSKNEKLIKNISVFITHDNLQDTEDAKRFLRGNGKMYSFAEGRKNIFHFETLNREFKQIFKTMSPYDYLLIGGNIVISSLVSALVYSEFQKVKVLVWNYHEKMYIEKVIDFDEK